MILHFKCHFCGVVVVVVVLLSISSFCIYTLRRKGVVKVLPFGSRNVNRPNFYTLRRKGVVEVLPFGPRNVNRPNFYINLNLNNNQNYVLQFDVN